MTDPNKTDLDRIARLERRIERERTARQEADVIAERALRDLYREKRRLALVETIAVAANLDDDPTKTFELALRRICEFTGWPVGQVYMFADETDERLRWSGVWYDVAAEKRNEFRQISSDMTFARGEGLPGRVWDTACPLWMVDASCDDRFLRLEAAQRASLHATFAFPALMGEQVGAVLEFFHEVPSEPDPDLLHLVAQIGGQLGRVIERYRNQQRLLAQAVNLEAQRAAAEQASRAKSDFLAVTSHEIRTPLNAVLGLSEALQREDLTPRQRELNAGVLQSGSMLLRLLNAVLDLSRIGSEQSQLEPVAFDLKGKLSNIISIWTPSAESGDIDLSMDVSAVTRDWIVCDEGRLEQTLVNLISNALKFTPSGGQVEVVARCEAQRLTIEVRDSGPGVPDDARERIFQPFEQTDVGRLAGGAGLGLAICAGNIGLMGGEIGCRNGFDVGTCFWIEVPFSVPASTPVAQGEAKTSDPVNPVTECHRPLRILAAEDNRANQNVLAILLEPAGVELTFADNGLEALEALARQPFDLVLMDANMPVMDGVEAVRRIRASEVDTRIPIHMLTANVFSEDVAEYMSAGADGVLNKPIELPRLYEVLQDCAASMDLLRAA